MSWTTPCKPLQRIVFVTISIFSKNFFQKFLELMKFYSVLKLTLNVENFTVLYFKFIVEKHVAFQKLAQFFPNFLGKSSICNYFKETFCDLIQRVCVWGSAQPWNPLQRLLRPDNPFPGEAPPQTKKKPPNLVNVFI